MGFVKKLLAFGKVLGRRASQSPARDEPEAPASAAGRLMAIDPFRAGGPFPAGRCEPCVEAEMGRPPGFEAYMAAALKSALGDAAPALWYAAQIAAGRLCGFRVSRVLNKARCAVCCDPGDPVATRLARVYVRAELGRLAARCGLEAKEDITR